MVKSTLWFLIMFTWLFTGWLTSNFTEKSSAQVLSGCPTYDPELKGWQKSPSGSISVKYFFVGNIFTTTQKDQIRQAFTKWTTASSTTCLKVNFVETQNESESKIQVKTVRSGLPMHTELDYDETGIVSNAEIRVNIRSSFYDPYGIGYDTVFLKGALHEIGHTMGLDEAPHPQQNERSVMNNPSPIDVNESFDRLPTDVQPCDIQSVNQNPQCSTPTPTPTPQLEQCYVPRTDESKDEIFDDDSQMRPQPPRTCDPSETWNETTCRCEPISCPVVIEFRATVLI